MRTPQHLVHSRLSTKSRGVNQLFYSFSWSELRAAGRQQSANMPVRSIISRPTRGWARQYRAKETQVLWPGAGGSFGAFGEISGTLLTHFSYCVLSGILWPLK